MHGDREVLLRDLEEGAFVSREIIPGFSGEKELNDFGVS